MTKVAFVVVHMTQDATVQVSTELVSSCRVCFVEAEGRRCLCTDGIELAVASTVIDRTVAAQTVVEATEVAVTAKGSSKTFLDSDRALLAVRATILLSLVAIAVAYRSSVLLLGSTISLALAEALKTERFS